MGGVDGGGRVRPGILEAWVKGKELKVGLQVILGPVESDLWLKKKKREQ